MILPPCDARLSLRMSRRSPRVVALATLLSARPLVGWQRTPKLHVRSSHDRRRRVTARLSSESSLGGGQQLLSAAAGLPYEGVLVDLGGLELGDAEAFGCEVESAVASWRSAGKLSAWLSIPLRLLRYGEVAARCGFRAHHAENDAIVLYKWLASSEDKVPPYAHTQVGCAGFAVNDRNEVLVVKEWRTVDGQRVPSAQWKLPGGMADVGESFLACAARETTEETGIACQPVSLLALWHRHNVRPWDKSDIYCVVRLDVTDETIRIDPEEISAAMWYDLETFRREQDHPLIRRIIDELYEGGASGPTAELLDLGVKWPGRERYVTYLPVKKVAGLSTGIRAVASDVDGTLLTSESALHPSNKVAIATLQRSPLNFFIATGKCRQGARNSLDGLSVEGGVFNNGLVVYADDGALIFERTLDTGVVDDMVNFAHDAGLEIVAYNRDVLTCLRETPRTDELATRYREPPVVRVDAFDAHVNKLLLMAPTDVIASVRPQVEARLEGRAAVTVALPTMLEILPFGASKREGVVAYCRHHGIDEATELLAVGDGENDTDMLRHAAVGVAMANAAPLAARAADVQLDRNNDQAGAATAFALALALRV